MLVYQKVGPVADIPKRRYSKSNRIGFENIEFLHDRKHLTYLDVNFQVSSQTDVYNTHTISCTKSYHP